MEGIRKPQKYPYVEMGIAQLQKTFLPFVP